MQTFCKLIPPQFPEVVFLLGKKKGFEANNMNPPQSDSLTKAQLVGLGYDSVFINYYVQDFVTFLIPLLEESRNSKELSQKVFEFEDKKFTVTSSPRSGFKFLLKSNLLQIHIRNSTVKTVMERHLERDENDFSTEVLNLCEEVSNSNYEHPETLAETKTLQKILKRPNVCIYFTAEGLWQYGFDYLYSQAQEFLNYFTRGLRQEQVSEVDMAVDFYGISLSIDEAKNIVTRALVKRTTEQTDLTTWETNLQLTGFRAGSNRNGSRLQVAFYDKSKEMKDNQHKSWFWDVWQLEPGSVDVYRVEVRALRTLLDEFNVETWQDFKRVQADIWQFAVGAPPEEKTEEAWEKRPHKGWCEIRLPVDENKSRCPVYPFWQQIQNADWGKLSGALPKKSHSFNKHHTDKVVKGFLESFAAAGEDMTDYLKELTNYVQSAEFKEKADVKKSRYQIWNDSKFRHDLVEKKTRRFKEKLDKLLKIKKKSTSSSNSP